MLWLIVSVAMAADDASRETTAVEHYMTQSSTAVIKSFEEKGTVSCVSVEVVRLTQPNSAADATGMRVAVTDVRDRQDAAWVDASELPALLANLEFLATFDAAKAAYPNWEVKYSTRDKFTINLFNRGGSPDDRMVAVSTPGPGGATCYLTLPQLAKFRDAVDVVRADLAGKPSTGGSPPAK